MWYSNAVVPQHYNFSNFFHSQKFIYFLFSKFFNFFFIFFLFFLFYFQGITAFYVRISRRLLLISFAMQENFTTTTTGAECSIRFSNVGFTANDTDDLIDHILFVTQGISVAKTRVGARIHNLLKTVDNTPITYQKIHTGLHLRRKARMNW